MMYIHKMMKMTRTCCLLSALLLHYCFAVRDGDADTPPSLLRGQRIQQIDGNSAHDRDAAAMYDPLRLAKPAQDADATANHDEEVEGSGPIVSQSHKREDAADNPSLQSSSSTDSAHHNPLLHTTTSTRTLATHPNNKPYRLFRQSPSSPLYSILSSKKSTRKQCHLVTLEIIWESLQQSRQTSWMVTLGSLQDLQDKHSPLYVNNNNDGNINSGEGTVVEYSHNSYYQPFERHAFCLPGKGLYTFTIFDWGGDGLSSSSSNNNNDDSISGSYTLYSDDRRVLVTGSKFKYMESQEFTLPLPPMETSKPSVSPSPTVSFEPTQDCDWVDIDILYDMYPEETTWMVILGDYSSLDNGNITIIEQSTLDSGLGEGFTVNVGAAGGSTMNTRVCLPGEGRYSFVIFDSYYNGICCEFGDGSYTITTPSLPGEILGQGGDFTTFDIVTFEVPFVRAPSSSPSISPYPTISHSPTVDCKYVQLELQFDGYSSETSWKITKNVDGKEVVVHSSPFYLDTDYAGVYTILTLCLPGEGTYTFTIEDKAGDGMCCLYSDGFYTLTYKGDGQEDLIIVTGGEFQYEDSTTFSVPYGGSNTLSPALTPAPTVKCYNVEVSITFDSYPYETIWLIVEGGFDGLSLSDDDAISLVVESPKYNFADLNTTDVHVECLPQGTYTFLIVDADGICCDYGDGEYTVTITKENGKEVVVKQGGEFSSVESVTFDLPFVPGSSPTMPPNNQGQPPTQAGETSRYWIDIDIKFDAKPYEISWVVTDNRANMIEESPYYTMFYLDGSESHRVYLPEPGEYSFTIFDKSGDGLCCTLDKNGNFQVTSHDPTGDVVILQGSDFGSEESITFTVPRDWDGTSMWPTPFQDWASSMWPTPVPSPPPFMNTPSPTVIDCTPVKVELLFDVFPYETSWWLVEGDLKAFENKKPKFIGKSPSYDDFDRYSTAEHTFCLADGQYSFMIFDAEGNGVCCKSGDGSYKLTYGENSEVFAKGGRFGFFDIVVFEVPFSSRSPSWTPVPTTMMPTSESPTIDTPAPTMGVSTPDCDILMDLTTETAGDQNAIRWEVVLGDQSSVMNSFALIVAQSEQEMFSTSSLNERTIDSDKVCLPGDGLYTFTIFDNNSDKDTRYRLIVDGVQVANGSDFGYQESKTFNVPGTGQPTPAPQTIDGNNNLSPTECTMIDISITFDEFPDETYWVLYEGGGDESDEAAVVANSPYYLNMTNSNSTSHQVCLPGDGEYTFAMYDVANDGMCCSFGKGGYTVSSVEEPVIIVAQGAEFEGADITTFSVPIIVAPSTAPTVTPRPTESASPTIPCSDIELTVTFDAYPSETSWTLYDAENNTVASSPFYQNIDFANDTIQENFCLPDGSYLFLITDQAGDGNCCAGLGDGSYSIIYQDGALSQVIVDKGPDPTFVYYDSTEFTIPYVLQPTKSPTLSPAPTTSMAPTARCVKMEVIINFDAFPSDTLWEITVGDSNSWDNNNAVIAADSPIYTAIDTFSTVTHSICLPGAETYTFTVFDGTGNGMCCDEGTGGFIILMIDDDGNREIIAEGGEFEWRLSTQFDLPINIGPRMSNL